MQPPRFRPPLAFTLRLPAVGALAATLACAQAVLDTPKKIEDARKLLDSFHGHSVGCDVIPIGPRFSYTLRLEAGYFVHVPLQQTQLDQKWVVLTRITPQAGHRSPIYLSDVVPFPARVPADPGGPVKVELDGSFWLGEGRYRVKWLAFDGSGDMCRKEWEIEAHLKSDERQVAPHLAPNSVTGTSPATETPPRGSAPAVERLTILLHAASLQQGQTVVGPQAKALLLDTLLGLMEQMPARSVRLVVFSLDQQKEILRKENFTIDALSEVAPFLTEPGAVDYRALQNPGGAVDFIETLVDGEIHASEPPGAIVFLGPLSIQNAKPTASFGLPSGVKTQFFYLLFPNSEARHGFTGGSGGGGVRGPRSPGVRMDAQADDPDIMLPNIGPTIHPANRPNIRPNHGPDSIQYILDQLGGKTLKVDSPDSFAHALAGITRTLGPNR